MPASWSTVGQHHIVLGSRTCSPGDLLEVANATGHQFEPMLDGRSGDERIGHVAVDAREPPGAFCDRRVDPKFAEGREKHADVFLVFRAAAEELSSGDDRIRDAVSGDGQAAGSAHYVDEDVGVEQEVSHAIPVAAPALSKRRAVVGS